jgi:hypothetical protein
MNSGAREARAFPMRHPIRTPSALQTTQWRIGGRQPTH